MPDVITPEAKPEVQEELPVEEARVEEQEQPIEQAPETVETEPQEPSAADLLAQLQAKQAEIDALKAEQPAPVKEAPRVEHGRVQDMAIRTFATHVIPEAKKAFSNPDATLEKQFETVVDTTDKLITAVYTERILPIAYSNIEIINKIDVRDLRAENPDFKQKYEPQVMAELEKMSWQDRSREGVVEGIYHRLLGKQNGKPAPAPAAKPKPAVSPSVLRDVSVGSPNAAPKTTASRLTPDQEADRQEMNQEGSSITPELYLAKLNSRNDLRKARNLPPQKTLRNL